MNQRTILAGVVGAVVLAFAGVGVFELGVRRGMRALPHDAPASAPTAVPQSLAEGEDATRRHLQAGLKAGDVDPVNGRRILYYHDPMAPAQRFERPAKSPFMDMMLVPVYEGAAGDDGNVAVSPRIRQNLGIRTAMVVEGTLSLQVSAVGAIAFNERDQAVVQARASGYVERLFVRATLDPVGKGQPLAELYVPDWVAAQEEYLSVRRMQGSDLGPLVDGARQRMRQAGMGDEQIRLVESSGRVHPRITLVAPVGGVVVELAAREGMTVTPGAMLFRINGLGTVWANAEVPESQAVWLRPGAKVRAKSPAVPGAVFEGKVQALLPEVNPATRTLKARMELANAGGRLAPGMFVTMTFTDTPTAKALVVPSDAVIQTGKRTVVMLAETDGHFRPVDVEPGIESGGRTEIKRGLAAGQHVVVSSQFLIDSEASLRGLESRLNAEPPAAAASAAASYAAEGTVEAIASDALTISHAPIAALQWPAMTMEFKLPTSGLPAGLAVGDRIHFEFAVERDGARLLTVHPLSSSHGAHASGSGR
jgi:membrane fusion protein, copper/silver efflux system